MCAYWNASERRQRCRRSSNTSGLQHDAVVELQILAAPLLKTGRMGICSACGNGCHLCRHISVRAPTGPYSQLPKVLSACRVSRKFVGGSHTGGTGASPVTAEQETRTLLLTIAITIPRAPHPLSGCEPDSSPGLFSEGEGGGVGEVFPGGAGAYAGASMGWRDRAGPLSPTFS